MKESSTYIDGRITGTRSAAQLLCAPAQLQEHPCTAQPGDDLRACKQYPATEVSWNAGVLRVAGQLHKLGSKVSLMTDKTSSCSLVCTETHTREPVARTSRRPLCAL